MKSALVLVVVTLFILISVTVNAVSLDGYVLVREQVLPLGSKHAFCITNIDSGQRERHIVTVVAYVVWYPTSLGRSIEYQIEVDGMPYWFIVNRETLDANNAC
jgi:hypothetical protein